MEQLREMSEAFANAIKEAASASTELDGCGLSVLVEDKLSDSFVIDSALGRNSICVIVGVTGFDRKPTSGRLVYGNVRFDVSVYENPAMNRETEFSATAQSVAEFIIRKMHWHRPNQWHSPLLFGGMTRADEYPCVVERLTFTAETELM